MQEPLKKELDTKNLQVQALLEYKERKEREDDQLRQEGGYLLARMPLKRTVKAESMNEDCVKASGLIKD